MVPYLTIFISNVELLMVHHFISLNNDDELFKMPCFISLINNNTPLSMVPHLISLGHWQRPRVVSMRYIQKRTHSLTHSPKHSGPPTPSTGLRHPSCNHCHVQLRHTGPRKLSADEQFFVGAQPLPCSVTPQVPENCQLTSSFLLVLNHCHVQLRHRSQKTVSWRAVFCWCSTTAMFSYATGPRKLSADEQFFFFVGAQTKASSLQTTQIIWNVCFMTDHAAYASSNKTKIVWIETELFSWPGVDVPHVYVRAWALGCFYSHISTQTFRRALTASLDSCAEIKECPFSAATKFGRVWRKVPESDAQSVTRPYTDSQFLRCVHARCGNTCHPRCSTACMSCQRTPWSPYPCNSQCCRWRWRPPHPEQNTAGPGHYGTALSIARKHAYLTH